GAAPLGRCADRDGLRLPWDGLLALQRDPGARFPRRRRRDRVRRDRGRLREPPGRHLVRLPQPEDPRLVSVAELEAVEIQLEAPSGLWRDAWQRLRRNPGAIIGAFFVLAFVVIAIFAPLIAPYSPTDVIKTGLQNNL